MYFTLMEEFHNTVVEYGPMNMALELKNRNIIPQFHYDYLSNLNNSAKHKSLVLFNYVMDAIINECPNTNEDFHAFLNNDRKLWHLSLRIRQTC